MHARIPPSSSHVCEHMRWSCARRAHHARHSNAIARCRWACDSWRGICAARCLCAAGASEYLLHCARGKLRVFAPSRNGARAAPLANASPPTALGALVTPSMSARNARVGLPDRSHAHHASAMALARRRPTMSGGRKHAARAHPPHRCAHALAHSSCYYKALQLFAALG